MSTSEKNPGAKIQLQKNSVANIRVTKAKQSIPTANIQHPAKQVTRHWSCDTTTFLFFACFLDKCTEIYRHHGVLNLVRVPCGKFKENKH